MPPALPTTASTPRLILVAPLLAFAFFACFWNLGASSISSGDEGIHVRVMQEMIETGRWVSPTLDGQPYFGKPPLKLALSKAVVLVFGDSNLAFRLLDGLAGFWTIVLTYALALGMFRSPTIASIAALLLSINRVFLFRHVVREAVQDSMLLLLSTAALFAGWKLLSLLATGIEPDSSRHARKLAALVGVLSGLAVLTKSAAGFFPLVIFYAALLLQIGPRSLFSRSTRIVWIPAACAMGFALLYYGLNILTIPDAGKQMITVNIQERLLGKGFHHVKQWDLYLELVFKSGRVAPVGLVVVGFLVGALGCVRSDPRYQYLMAWSVIPLVGMSALSSRLDWYLAPAFPGIALLCAAGLIGALSSLTIAARRAPSFWRRTVATLGAFLLSGYACFSISRGALDVTQRVLHAGPPSAFERICRAIRSELRGSGPTGKVALFGLTDALSPRNAPFNLHKKVYLSMLAPYSVNVDSVEELTKLKDSGSLAFVFAPASREAELKTLSPCALRVIPARINNNPAEPGSWPAVVLAALTACDSFRRW